MELGVDGEKGGGDWQFPFGAKLGEPTPCSRSLLAHKPHSLTRAEGAASLASLFAEAAGLVLVWVLSRPVAEPPPVSAQSSLATYFAPSTKHSTILICNYCSSKLYLYESFRLYPFPPAFMVRGVPATQKAPCGSRGSPLPRECIRLGLHSLTAYTIIGAWTSQGSTILMSSPLQ